MPRRFGFGLGFNISRLSGLPEPSGFVAKYQAYDVYDFTLVTGSNVSQWDDRTTQTFGSEEVTNGTFDTDSDWTKGAGWTISGGTAEYSGNNGTSAIQQPNINTPIGNKYLITIDVVYNEGIGTNPIDIGGVRVNNTHLDIGTHEFIYTPVISSGTLLIYARDGERFEIDNISVKEILTGANHLTQGTSSNQPILTQDANRFNNKVDFGTNDFMTGLPPQSGDFTYVFKGLNLPTDTGSSRVFLSNPSSINALFYVVGTSDKFAIRDNTNTINEFNKVIDYGVSQTVTLTRSGNLYSLYIDGVFQDSITITAGVSVFTALGRANPSFDGSLQELYVYDRALTQSDIRRFQ